MTTENTKNALKALLPLAERGDAKAQANLGWIYYTGNGVHQDYWEAAHWYRKAAVQGKAAAQTMLGLMCNKGEGVACDDTRAVRWYRKAAEQGEPTAQAMLGLMYGKGTGVLCDYVQAHMWLSLAVANGMEEAAPYRAVLTAKMTPLDILKAEIMAKKCKANQYKAPV